MFLSCSFIVQIDIARVSRQRFRDIIAFLSGFPLVGERNYRLFDIILGGNKVVLLIVVESSTQAFGFALEARRQIDVSSGNTVPPYFNTVW